MSLSRGIKRQDKKRGMVLESEPPGSCGTLDESEPPLGRHSAVLEMGLISNICESYILSQPKTLVIQGLSFTVEAGPPLGNALSQGLHPGPAEEGQSAALDGGGLCVHRAWSPWLPAVLYLEVREHRGDLLRLQRVTGAGLIGEPLICWRWN